MQDYSKTPIFSDVADFYFYPVLTSTGSTNSVTISAAGGGANGYLTLIDQNYFLHTGWQVWTNYDNAGGVRETAAVTAAVLAAPPFQPNNFQVNIAQGQNNVFSNRVPLTQAELCSSGNFSGKQNPWPVIYGPSVTFDFEFTDLTGLYLLTGSEAIPLQIKLFMVGYKIPVTNLQRFLNYFPGLKKQYAKVAA